MKTLTVWQPWASLLVLGFKGSETRGWRTNYTGDLLIHAARRPVRDGLAIMDQEARREVRGIFKNDRDALENRPTGAIVGKCTLSTCVQVTEGIRQHLRKRYPTEYVLGDYTPGRYSWIMNDAAVFEEPIPAAGKQGLWNYDGEMGKVRERHEKYKEILLLKHLLQERGIRFELAHIHDGYHMGVPRIHGIGNNAMRFHIMEHFASFGSEEDKLEIIKPSGAVLGFADAKTAVNIIAAEMEAKRA